MRKIEQSMVTAIREVLADSGFTGQYWKGGNTVIFQTTGGTLGTPSAYRYIEVILYDTVIALIEPQASRLSLYTGGFRTITTKSRLNAILESFGDGFYIAQHKGQWATYKVGYFYDTFTEGHTFTLWP